jgi:hypothetical protein
MKVIPSILVLTVLAIVSVSADIEATPTPSERVDSTNDFLTKQRDTAHDLSFDFPSDLEVGRQLELVGDFEGAIACYRKALGSPDAALRRIALDLITKTLPKKREKEEKEDSFRTFLDLGDLWNRESKTDEAMAAYEKALGSKWESVRTPATKKLSELIKKKTTWWREYLTTPLSALLMLLLKPVVIAVAALLTLIIARWCIGETDLLLVPNSAVPDTKWLQALIEHYDHRAKRFHTFPSKKSAMSLVSFGSAGELFVDLLSRIAQVEPGPWRQRLVRFLQKPRFELELSMPPNNEGGIVTATLDCNGKTRARLIKEVSKDDFPAMQKDLAFWVAYEVRQHPQT